MQYKGANYISEEAKLLSFSYNSLHVHPTGVCAYKNPEDHQILRTKNPGGVFCRVDKIHGVLDQEAFFVVEEAKSRGITSRKITSREVCGRKNPRRYPEISLKFRGFELSKKPLHTPYKFFLE